jgi:hypothetical protein
MAHALASDGGTGDLDAALLANNTLIADVLILPTITLPVLRRAEDGFAEQAVLFGA